MFLEVQRVDEVIPNVWWRFGRWITHLGLLTLLIAATATDLREYIIPDQITLPGVLLGVLLATVSGDLQLIHVWVDWNHPLVALQGPEIPSWLSSHPHWHGLIWSLTGAATGAGVTWLARGISSAVLGQEAMGFGDVTLMAMIGSFLGWQPMLFVFLLAPFCGLVVGVTVKSLLNRPYVPYGPYLNAAAIVVMLSWRWIWSWEPTPRVSIRKLFGDLPSLAILAGASLVLLLVLLGLALVGAAVHANPTNSKRSPEWSFDRSKGGVARVLVEDFDFAESHLAEQIQLKHHRAGRVFTDDACKQFVAICLATDGGQVLAVAPPMDRLDLWQRTFNQIENPNRAVRLQGGVELLEDGTPLVVRSQMVQHGGRQNDVESLLTEIQIAHVGMDRLDRSRRLRLHSVDRAIEHLLAQIDQRDVEVGQSLQQLQGVVPAAAADIE